MSGASNTRLVQGYLSAAALTAVPFWLVWQKALSPEATLIIIAMAAMVQIGVHLVVFLGVGRGAGARLGSLVFAVVLLGFMIGGTLWIMADLGYRMGH